MQSSEMLASYEYSCMKRCQTFELSHILIMLPVGCLRVYVSHPADGGLNTSSMQQALACIFSCLY